ncbi:MAG: hypothetical protein WDO13_08210 [Verrucomicrobiota bacterium]
MAGWFGRELHRELNVPIGLICTAWGGSRVQAWISREGLMSDPDGRDAVLKYEREVFLPPSDDHFASFQDWERSQALRDQGNAGLAKAGTRPTMMTAPGRRCRFRSGGSSTAMSTAASSGFGAPSPSRPTGPAGNSSCTSARSTSTMTPGSTASGSAGSPGKPGRIRGARRASTRSPAI